MSQLGAVLLPACQPARSEQPPANLQQLQPHLQPPLLTGCTLRWCSCCATPASARCSRATHSPASARQRWVRHHFSAWSLGLLQPPPMCTPPTSPTPGLLPAPCFCQRPNCSPGWLQVILEGCIPVFVGPPFHTLPLAQDIDYAGMGLFLSVAQRPWVLDRPKDRQELADWAPDADIEPHVVRLDSLAGVYPYLKGLPPAVVAAKHAAVLRERLKMYYAVPPGRGTSVLGDLILAHLCRHAAARRQARRTEEAAGARAGPLSAGGVGEEGGDEDEGEGQRFDYEAADRRAAL